MDILADEYFKLIDVVSRYDDHLLTIKGWSITVGMALIGYGFTQKKHSIFLLCSVSAICFALVDAKFKQYQVSYYPRMQAIEECKRDESVKCFPLQVDASWKKAKSENGYFAQFKKHGVLMPHFVLVVLSLFLYIIYRFVERK